MRNMSSIMNALYFLSEWFVRFTFVNLVWFVLNIPLTIVTLNFILSETERIIYVLPMVILSVFLFFPSTMALYGVVRDWIMKKERSKNIRRFFKFFKKDYFRSLLAGAVWTIIWLVWVVDYIYFEREDSIISLIVLVLGIILFVAMIDFFSLSAHYDMRFMQLMKNALLVTIGNPFLFVIVVVIHALLFYAGITYLLFIFPLFIGTVTAFISFLGFYRFTLKLKEKE